MSTPTENSKKELVVIVRPSFVKITQQQDKKGNPCRAAVYNHILYSIACKARNTNNKEDVQHGKVYWYAKNEDIVEEMSHTWEVCTVRKEVNELVKRGFFGKISNPHWGADRTKHFVFGKEQCELLLNRCKELGICLFHLELPVDIIHLINLSNANDKNIGCTCNNYQMQMINLSKQNDKFIEAITEITTENTTEITTREESDAPTNTQPECIVGLSTDAPSQDVSSEEKQASESVDHNTPQSDETPVRIADETTPDEASKQDEQGKVEQPPLVDVPLSEPDMTGRWVHETCVLYAEWKHGKRYTTKMREAQVKAAQWLHKEDKDLTLAQFKAAYDERDDEWWMEHKQEHPNVTDMKAKEQASGVVRVYAMLQKIEARGSKPRRDHLKVVPPLSQERPDVLVSQEKKQSNKDKLRALVEADKQRAAAQA